MSWLINYTVEDFLLYGPAKKVWDAAKETYSNNDIVAELFVIESRIHGLRQGENTVAQYFMTLTKHWQLLDMIEEHKWKCAEDEMTFKKIVERERIFKFLLGLNENLDEVRWRILRTEPLPSIRETFSEVRREESRQKVMMGSSTTTSISKNAGSALVARGSNANRQRKGRTWCDHCRRPGHTKETCWKLHGKPAD